MRLRFLLISFALLFALPCFSQGVRFSSQVQEQGTIATTTNAVILPANPIVKFCNAPANAVPCSNLATTYTDATLVTPCATSTQIVLDGTNSCVGNPDAQNNWGVWVQGVCGSNPCQYAYTITVNGTNLGPYYVTASAGSGGGLGPTVQTNGVNNTSQTLLNLQTSTANSVGLTATPSNPSGGIERFEIAGNSYSGNAGTASNLSGTPLLPNGTTATTQPPGTNNNTLATSAALLAAVQTGSKAILATAYGVFADANTDGTASMTSGSNVVTTSSIAIPFTSAMQGNIFFGTDAPAAGSFSGTAGTVIINGYICLSGGFVDAHTVNICTTPTGTTHANATLTCTSTSSNGLCQAAWGAHDDGPALQTAFTAAMQNDICGHLILPDGNMLTSIVPHVLTSRCGDENTNVGNFSYAVTGGGMGTTKIIPLPSLSLSDSTNGCDQVTTLCFFSSRLSTVNVVLANFTIDGMGNGTPTGYTSTYYLIGMPAISALQNVSVYNYANNSSSNVVCAFNAGGLFLNLNCWNGGYNGVVLDATFGQVTMISSLIINPGGSSIFCATYQAVTSGNGFNGGTANSNVMTALSGASSTAGIWNSSGDYFESGGPQGGFQVLDASGYINLIGDQLVSDVPTTGAALGMSWNNNPGFVHSMNTQFRGGSGFWISGHIGGGGSAAGGIFTDLGNNSTSGTVNPTGQSNFTIVNYPAEPSVGGRCLLASAAGPLACGYSGNGIVAIPTTTTTYVIDTQAVLAGSIITLSPTTDCSGVSGTPTCVLPSTLGDVYVSARTAGTSFTITLPSTTGIVGVAWSIR